MNEVAHHTVRRPTEEQAFARLIREATKLGISQIELIRRYSMSAIMTHDPMFCHCIFCRRRRANLIT